MPLAEAAGALGRLDATLAALPPEAAAGAVTRLALAEIEAMLWAGGIVLPREEIGRDALDARAASDPEAMRLARWALRRLDGQVAFTDLPGFLGLHRGAGAVAGSEPGPMSGAAARLRGPDFERGAAGYLSRLDAAAELHPLVRGCLAGLLWRQAELSPPDRVIEPAVHAARLMAQGSEHLRFAPLGNAGRRVWTAGGPVAERLAGHLAAVAAGARAGREEIRRLEAWAAEARRATSGIRGQNAGGVIAVSGRTAAGLGRGRGHRRRDQPDDRRTDAQPDDGFGPDPRDHRRQPLPALAGEPGGCVNSFFRRRKSTSATSRD